MKIEATKSITVRLTDGPVNVDVVDDDQVIFNRDFPEAPTDVFNIGGMSSLQLKNMFKFTTGSTLVTVLSLMHETTKLYGQFEVDAGFLFFACHQVRITPKVTPMLFDTYVHQYKVLQKVQMTLS